MKRLIIGAGGHANVVRAALLPLKIDGFSALKNEVRIDVNAMIVGSDDDVIANYAPGDTMLYNGIGANPKTALRRAVFEKFKGAGFRFGVVSHASVINLAGAENEGCQVMAGAVLQVGVHLGHNTVVNTGAIIEHDCVLGAHAFVGPGATLCGQVTIGEGASIGAGAVILPGCRVGANAVVGAGAVVTKDVPAETTVLGVPARQMAPKHRV